MRRCLLSTAWVAAFAATGLAQTPFPVSAERMKADVATLSSDEYQGRGPGTRGEELATGFLAKHFEKIGLKPIGDKGTYFQPVPLLRVATDPAATLSATKGGNVLNFKTEDDFAGTSHTQTGREAFEAEAVFVGHGIVAPEFGWDDYAGIDVKGKIVVLFTNEPPSEDPKFFGGPALTYYGRWTFKFEEAARRGAKACFIIHTSETAGYPWSVVKPLDGAQLKNKPGTPALAFAGWLSRKAGDSLLGLAGKTVDAALKEADTKGFKPFSLGVTMKANVPYKIESTISNNVVGMIEGSDPTLKSEAVIVTAHWDHLGVGRAGIGDNIFNGAADNATGCAILLEMARAWQAQSPKPKRSAVFLAVTAEEKGLLGSKYYSENPILPLSKTALNLNFDMIMPLGIPETVVLNGSERMTAQPTIERVAKAHGLTIEPDPRAALGIFYRSDHFSMARAGVPAFSVSQGSKIKGKPADFVKKSMTEFNDKRYHQPGDEMQPDWDFSGFVTLVNFGLDLGREIANGDKLPEWNEGDEFRKGRK